MSKVIDIETRSIVDTDGFVSSSPSDVFMARWSNAVKSGHFSNIVIMVMDDNGVYDMGITATDETKLSLMALLTDDLKKAIKDSLFGEDD